jgi:hypothetical protein
MSNIGITNSWSLLSFAFNKKMQVGNFVNKDTGETFKSCIFTDKTTGDRCFVAFSSNLGELSPAQISEMKHELQVVELTSGNYSLCKQGHNNWEDVEL